MYQQHTCNYRSDPIKKGVPRFYSALLCSNLLSSAVVVRQRGSGKHPCVPGTLSLPHQTHTVQACEIVAKFSSTYVGPSLFLSIET